ncbi:UspA domain protein [Desulfarculus baarsii DSM 2075]|uniref:UspA domain protein n=1 Tax=Desulfarculus baarsii (strain ATCC 33931 / DSM 2075 / LMG 7858 / VKM B-1802 / 2st14) TaxID=644282 RepID=E1QDJ4_DESB2|nr:universal stress protein [Desulfarculus baarsii]ADK83513.1 UspA domain protein [Desulfarculus baarsii DSM 2075]
MKPAQPFSHIMVCTDFSPGAARAVAVGAQQARLDGARLSLVHVVAPGAPVLPQMAAKSARVLDNHEVAHLCHQHMENCYGPDLSGLPVKMVLRRGHPVVEIVAQLEQDPADLLVVGSQGLSGMGLILFGSVAERLARRAACATLIAR